jgi:death on curing protein
MKTPPEPLWLTPQDIEAIYSEIMSQFLGIAALLTDDRLDSTLAKPRNLHHYHPDTSLHHLAAAYGYGLAKNHCFVDGNKRIALIATYTFLAINGIELTAPQPDTTRTFIDLAASQAPQDQTQTALAHWLAQNSQPIAVR